MHMRHATPHTPWMSSFCDHEHIFKQFVAHLAIANRPRDFVEIYLQQHIATPISPG